ncbi:hypothetical protein [Denitrobaculum tricleocarpae]|uniref:HEAT repeat domain-containing protein n=1 Tax=Denitrobaculum tricleocarpae TaxID=2591009 RepID=A0A545TEM3_9PROT|nr:hypothetical protein [Denitrobaculum tricleocarpae]TQV75670.1 hypothetical protein FKG95_22355 [Denitrobaculum tricleocarpae]
MSRQSRVGALENAVVERVLEFDGKTTGSLEAACKAVGPDFTGFARLFELAASEDTRLQIAATWALRKLLKLGAEMTAAHCEAFIETATAQTAWEAQLHIAQSVQFIGSEDLNARRLADIITPWHKAKRPFLRAWTLDALCRLAHRDTGLKETAATLLTKAGEDPTASVRARARNLKKANLL